MRLDSLGKPYLVQAIHNAGKPPANLGNSIPLKQAKAPSEESSNPTQEQSLGRVIEFISKQRRQQQKKDQKERGKVIAEEYKRVEGHIEEGNVVSAPKGQNLNIKV